MFVVVCAVGACTGNADHWRGWQPTGDLAGNSSFVTAAIRAWDTPSYGNGSGGGPKPPPTFPVGTGKHRGAVRVLFAGHVAFGRLAILVGNDVHGHSRLVVIVDDGNVSVSRLVATNNVASPDIRRVGAIAIEHGQTVLVGDRVAQNDYVFVVTRAGIPTVRLSSRKVQDATGMSPPQPGSIPTRKIAVRARTASTRFQRTRPLAATTLPITSLDYTGDVMPDGLLVATTPTGKDDVSPPVLISAACFICA